MWTFEMIFCSIMQSKFCFTQSRKEIAKPQSYFCDFCIHSLSPDIAG